MSWDTSASFSAHFIDALPPNRAFRFQKEVEGQEGEDEERKVEESSMADEREKTDREDHPHLSSFQAQLWGRQ